MDLTSAREWGGVRQLRFEAMLILTRRIGETIKIGDDITLTVLGVKGNQVRLGVGAPRHVAVHREEIYARIVTEHEDPKVTRLPGV